MFEWTERDYGFEGTFKNLGVGNNISGTVCFDECRSRQNEKNNLWDLRIHFRFVYYPKDFKFVVKFSFDTAENAMAYADAFIRRMFEVINGEDLLDPMKEGDI